LVRLEVAHWRGLESQVVDFGSGVTVVGGPNESGKSSLRLALRAALLLPTDKRGEKRVLESHRPWKTRLFPSVTLDFVLDDSRFRIEKEFLRPKGWGVLRRDGRIVAQDEEAQRQLMTLLGPQAEWLDTLWGVQGELALERGAPESLKGRLAAAAEDTVMPQVAALEGLLGEEYAKYWTDKRGLPNKKLQSARDGATHAERRVQSLEAELAAANTAAEELQRRRGELDQRKARKHELEVALQRGQEALGAWEAYARAQAEVKHAQSTVAHLEQGLAAWHRLVADVQRLWPDSVRWQQQVEALKPRLVAPTRTDVEGLKARHAYLDLALAREHRAALEATPMPSQADLAELRRVEDGLRTIDAQLQQGAIQARLTAVQPLQVTLTRDDGMDETRALGRGTSDAWTAEQGFDLVLPGVASLRVETARPNVAGDIRQRNELQQRLTGELARWSVDSIVTLQQQAASREAQLAHARTVSDKQWSAARALVPDADGLDGLDRASREQLLEALPAALLVAEAGWKTAEAQYRKSLDEYHALTERNPPAELERVLGDLRRHLEQAPTVTVSIPQPLTDAWVQSLPTVATPWLTHLRQVQDQVAALRQAVAVPAGEEVTPAILARLRQDVDSAGQALETLTAQVHQAIGQIGAQGDLYSRLVAAREAHQTALLEQRRVDLEALSARELMSAFDTARQQLQQDVVAPLQSRVVARFAALTGGAYRSVAFDAALKPDTVSAGAVESIELDAVSFGTREQLSLVTRLCLAELLAESTVSQVVVLDDNLVHTDEARMALACRILEDAAATVQIVVFTCHPERYRAIRERHEVLVPGRLVHR
jgi:DNA repair exonuclease SbcCD ATPase subunit